MAHYYQKCLKGELARRLQRNPAYSQRAFAKTLRLPSGALNEIMQGRRGLSYRMAKHILESLNLDSEGQRQFLLSTAQASQSRRRKRRDPDFRKLLEDISEVENNDAVRLLPQDIFKTIADWYHYAILELTFCPDFQGDPVWIASELGISSTEAELALERLHRLKLLEFHQGKLVKTGHHLQTDGWLTTAPALRERQRQVLQLSEGSLSNDPINQRNHTAITMAIDPKLLPEARKRIQKFMFELCEFLESGTQKKVYELVVNLFPLQRSPVS